VSIRTMARDRVVNATRGLFSHGPYPLADTLSYPGDPGLFGPDSMSWRVVGDTAVFVGGIRALLVQAAHPEVAAGVAEHSRYRDDPLGRLTRTSAYVTATCFGAMPEVDHAIKVVHRRHRPVIGTSHRGRPYDASDPELDAWVHNSLTDSFLAAYRAYGAQPCRESDADRYVEEQTRVGVLVGASPLPATAADLSSWIAGHRALAPSPGQREAVEFLRRPPLPPAVRAAYGVLYRAAVATLPEPICDVIGVRPLRGDHALGRTGVTLLRSALGASPDWRLALERVGAPLPPDIRFRQSLPTRVNRH
jgi:uncharacterized protein (DUF2236 family)